jgi:DNA-binding response OmpR family regulator
MSKILIVEDDLHIQDIFKIIFKSHGYEVDCVDRGELIANVNPPDVIILDKQLPGVNGVTVCKNLKADDKTRNIPVIMISALTGTKEAALAAGADDYIEKPFNMHIILKKVSELLTNTRRPQ